MDMIFLARDDFKNDGLFNQLIDQLHPHAIDLEEGQADNIDMIELHTIGVAFDNGKVTIL